jgi:hypothetical protein
MDTKDFERLLRACTEVAIGFPDGVVFIGGIAVYLHAVNTPSVADLAETTHDADFYISLADMGDLRDLEEVTSNRKANKHQFRRHGFEFDIYTERQSRLIVPYDMVMGYSEAYESVRVAGLTELFCLKLEAYRDRQSSAKGTKDAKDLLRIAAIASARKGFDAERAAAYLSDDHAGLLDGIGRGPAPMEMARGNAVKAKALRSMFVGMVAPLRGLRSG